MGRIRSIKPEFPQSESIGRLSRDARLLFIELWTICDDSGRARGASRVLASLLFPYDDDAPELIGGWLDELEHEGCIRRYEVDGSTYLDIPKWLKHQKIDHPSKSKIPEYIAPVDKPRESSRNLAPDLGPRTMDRTMEGEGERAPDGATPCQPPVEDDGLDLPAMLDRSELGDAVRQWNAMAEPLRLTQVQSLNEARRKKLKARLAECGGLEGWATAMAKVAASPFLRGDNDRGWRADFDFVLQQKSFTKLMEGAYDDRSGGRGGGGTIAAAFDELYRQAAEAGAR